MSFNTGTESTRASRRHAGQLAHGTSTDGQLAALWREGSDFVTRVIARYDSMPEDWLPQSDGSWLVLTQTSIWRWPEPPRYLAEMLLPKGSALERC